MSGKTLQPGPSGAPASCRRVLVAEDEVVLGRTIARVLGAEGFDVVTVTDGNAALYEIMNGGFDVIVTDIAMPGSSGIDLLRVVRAYDLDVPVILMTGNPDVSTAMEAVELGAIQYFAKPFELSELLRAVERASQLHRLARAKREALTLLGQQSAEAGDRAGLEVRLDKSLASLWIAFQPIVDYERRQIVAYEALLRSDEPSLPHPPAVLSAAERLGRLPDVGRRVREVVARDIADAPAGALVFVNVHPSDLLDPELASESCPLSPHAERIVLEITERSGLESVRDVETRVDILRYLGYRVAIDDLGAGYAGLTSFAALEPEFVKLDMSLVRDIHTSEIRQKLVQSLTAVCAEMGKTVIAEGVEVEQERRVVSRLGCGLMQGYLFARPERKFADVRWS
ncbi:MAG: EAL domain-containing protein [Polyangiaceae bacterium]|nr:EAL domain-containing protein [Polyangiaceae bacterium]